MVRLLRAASCERDFLIEVWWLELVIAMTYEGNGVTGCPQKVPRSAGDSGPYQDGVTEISGSEAKSVVKVGSGLRARQGVRRHKNVVLCHVISGLDVD